MSKRIFLLPASLGFTLTLVLLAFPGSAVAAAQPSVRGNQLSSVYAGKAASTNSNCHRNCIKYFRQGNHVKLVILDQDGQIFAIRTVHVAKDAKLAYHNPDSEGKGTLKPYEKGVPGTYWADNDSTIYAAHRNGHTYITTVTVTSTYYVRADGTNQRVSVSVGTKTVEVETNPV